MTSPVPAPPRFLLQRLDYTDRATFGMMLDAEEREIVKTLELPWRYNAKGVSCIPPGTYRCFRKKSPKRGYWLYELLSVPGRSNIEIHVGNTTKDSEGCILVGERFGDLGGVKGVLDSRVAFAKWMAATRNVETITLEVRAPVINPPLVPESA